MRYLIVFIIVIGGFACTNNLELLQTANRVSDSISNRFAPDGREAIFKISFRTRGKDTIVVHGETSLPKAKLSLISALEKRNIHLVDSLIVLPEKELGHKNWGIINLSVGNLRAFPRHSAELVSQATMGTPVRILKKRTSWYQVQTPDKYIGWVDEAAVNLRTAEEMAIWREAERVLFLPSFAVAKASNQKEIVTDLVAGSILEVDSKSGSNYHLRLPDGRTIEVHKSDLQPVADWKKKSLQDASMLIQTAKQFMGHPYLWGGTSPKGVDCSGFVKSVYFMNGIILARDASLQFRYGDWIAPEKGFADLKEGDLVFFGKKGSEKQTEKVTHVGMYMDQGEYIHASGMVKINSFDPEAENYNDYRTTSWLGGRRVLNHLGEEGLVQVKDHPWY